MNKEEIKLNMLCDIYGSDKGSMIDDIKYETYNGYAHNYTKIYSLLFSPLKMEKINILEVGLGTNNTSIPSNMGELGKPGASLRVWKDYFNNASIYGADVDKDILFQEDRITTGYMDQLDKNSIEEFFKNLDLLGFDYLVGYGAKDASAKFLEYIKRIMKEVIDRDWFLCVEN
jgi:hypothetical protein